MALLPPLFATRTPSSSSCAAVSLRLRIRNGSGCTYSVHVDVVEAGAHQLHHPQVGELLDEARREGVGAASVGDDGLGALQRGHEVRLGLVRLDLSYLRQRQRAQRCVTTARCVWLGWGWVGRTTTE